MTSTDACFGETNLRHGVEFVSSLYLSRLEQQSESNSPTAGSSSDDIIFSSAAMQRQSKKSISRKSKNEHWALERVVAVPGNADASEWLADVNRCRLRLSSTMGRSVLPRLDNAVPSSHQSLAIQPVEVEVESSGFDYLILREYIPAPTADKIVDFFRGLPASEEQRFGNSDKSSSSSFLEVKRVSLEGAQRQQREQYELQRKRAASANPADLALLAAELEENQQQQQASFEGALSSAPSSSSTAAAAAASASPQHHGVVLSVSSPAALCAPKNSNEFPQALVRPWLNTRVSLSTAPLYSFLGGTSLNIDQLQLHVEGDTDQEKQQQVGEVAGDVLMQKKHRHRDGGFDRVSPADVDKSEGAVENLQEGEDDASDDPFEQRPIVRAAVDIEEKLQLPENEQQHHAATARPRRAHATREQMNLHDRIQRRYDAQYLVEVFDRDSARDRVSEKLAESPEYAACYDLLQDIDVTAASRSTVHRTHTVAPDGDRGIFALSKVLGEGDSRRKRNAAQRVIELFGLRSSLSAVASQSLFSQLVYDTFLAPVFGVPGSGEGVQLLQATAFANPLGFKDDVEAYAAGHAVINPSSQTAAAAAAAAGTSTAGKPPLSVFTKLLRLLPQPWLVDMSLKKTRDPAHYITAEVDSFSSGRLDLCFATAPQWTFYTAWKDRTVSQLPLSSSTSAWGHHDLKQQQQRANVIASDAAVSPSPRLRSHQRVLESQGNPNAAREVLFSSSSSPNQQQNHHHTTPPQHQHHSHANDITAANMLHFATPQQQHQQHQQQQDHRSGLPPLSPPTSSVAVPAAAVAVARCGNGGDNNDAAVVGFVTPARTPNQQQNQLPTPAPSTARRQHVDEEGHQQHHQHIPAASSAFSPMSYTSRVTASTRRHFDGQFMVSPHGIAHKKQHHHHHHHHQQQQGAAKSVHVADGRTVELGANYQYKWDREWEVAVEEQEQQQQQQQRNQTEEEKEAATIKPMPSFWDRLEFKGCLSLMYGMARRAGELESDINQAYATQQRQQEAMPLFSPGRNNGGSGIETMNSGMLSPSSAAGGGGGMSLRRTRQEERDAYRTYLGDSAVPPGDGSTRFYSVFNVSASWIAEKMLWSPSALMRLRGGCRWALASDPSAVPTLDEKNRADDASNIMMRGSPFLNHFFASGQTTLLRGESAGGGNAAAVNRLRQSQQQQQQQQEPMDVLSSRTAGSTCIHQPQGAFVIEFERLFSRGFRSNFFLGATASCHLLSGYDYLSAINADVFTGPTYFSQLFGAPMLVAPSVARAAESRARGGCGGASQGNTGLASLLSPYRQKSDADGGGASALSQFSAATNLRALAEVVAGISLSMDLATPVDMLGEKPAATKDMGRRLEMSWWWPLLSVDTLRASDSVSSALFSSSGGGTQGAESRHSSASFFAKAPMTHRFGLSLHL